MKPKTIKVEIPAEAFEEIVEHVRSLSKDADAVARNANSGSACDVCNPGWAGRSARAGRRAGLLRRTLAAFESAVPGKKTT